MAQILLAGAFDERNPGDDALRRAFVHGLPDHDVVPATGRTDPTEVARLVRDASGVVFAGGTVFKELRPVTGRPPLDLLARGLALAVATRASGRPLAMVGVGAGKLTARRGHILVRQLVRQADLLVLRDEESARILTEAGAPSPFRVGADAAWTLLDGLPDGGWDEGGPVRVACSHEAGGEDLAATLAAALVPVIAAGRPVELQPWQIGGPGNGDDLDLARDVRRRLGGAAELMLPPETLLEAVDGFRGACAVLAMRFHAIPAAVVAGVPVVAYDHEAKLAGLARRLGAAAVGPGVDPASVGHAVLAAAACGPVVTGARMREEIALAEEGFRLLRILLDGGRSFEDAAGLGELPLRPAEWAT